MGDAAYKKRHKEQGLCVDCSRPAIPGQLRCIIHARNIQYFCARWCSKNREKKNKYWRNKRAEYKKEGRCVTCGAPLGEQDEGRTHCVNCRDRKLRIIPKCKPVGGELLEDYYEEVAKKS